MGWKKEDLTLRGYLATSGDILVAPAGAGVLPSLVGRGQGSRQAFHSEEAAYTLPHNKNLSGLKCQQRGG